MAAQIYAHDDHGTRLLDGTPPGSGSSPSNLNLSANLLTWTNDGIRRRATLR